MKTHFWKRASALALVLSLFVCLLSAVAMAEEPNTEEDPSDPHSLLSDDTPVENADPNEEETPAENADPNEEGTPAEGSGPETPADSSACTNGGQHTPGAERYLQTYSPCRSGWTTDYYYCTECNLPVKADGSPAEYLEATEDHIPGDPVPANYTECLGGWMDDGFACKVCGLSVTEDGTLVNYGDGTGKHIADKELYKAEGTPCSGGYLSDFYRCKFCNFPVTADGSEAPRTNGNGKHQTTYTPAVIPTYEKSGCVAYWKCSVCHWQFPDSEGKRQFHSALVLPPLTQGKEAKTEPLTDVPDTLAYQSVEGVQTALLDSAKSEGFQPGEADAGGVLLDVTLHTKEADGTLTPVDPKDFPENGVTVILPYPDGTDKSYAFVITHMITHGINSGQIEVLPSVNGDDGIYVFFPSMSPVYISYMPDTDTPAAAVSAPAVSAPAASAPDSTVPKTSDANHGAPWGMLMLLAAGGLGALCIAGKKLRRF